MPGVRPTGSRPQGFTTGSLGRPVLVFVLLLLLSALSVAGLTAAVIRFSPRVGLVDFPVARSAHSLPRPLGGGVALAAPFFVFGIFGLQGDSQAVTLSGLAGCLGVFLVGLVDDFRPLSLRLRLPLQFLAAAFVVQGLSLPAVDFFLFELTLPWLLLFLALVSLVWLCNLVNFMDGIDGIVAAQLLFCAVACACLTVLADSSHATELERGAVLGLCAVLTGSALGFLLWNWSPARLFMGDAGSVFCGFALGLLAFRTLELGLVSVWSWLLLLGAFVADTGVTLLRRALRGETLSEGHSEHAYQHLARRWSSHPRVVLSLVAVNCLYLFPLAWLAGIYPQYGVLFAAIGLLPVAAAAEYVGAGRKPSAA